MNKLLFVNPNPRLTGIYRRSLSDHFSFDSATDGLDAIRKIKRFRPNIVVSEYYLPNLSGLSLLQYVRRHPQLHTLPFIFFSQHQAHQDGLSFGATDWLVVNESNPQTLTAKCYIHMKNEIYV